MKPNKSKAKNRLKARKPRSLSVSGGSAPSFAKLFREAEKTPAYWKAMYGLAEKRSKQMERAIRWALGEKGDFPQRQDGQGAYWWRTELRRRALLNASGEPRPPANP